MDPSFYEKAADAANYIYFQKNVITEDGGKILPHFHDSIEFVFMSCGECLVHINTEERVVKQGEITFARCFEPHFYVPRKGAEYYVVLISSRYLKAEFIFPKRHFLRFYLKTITAIKFYGFWTRFILYGIVPTIC